MQGLTFVIPSVKKDFDLLKCCVYSLVSLFENNDIDGIYVIVPSTDVHLFCDEFKSCKLVITKEIPNIRNTG